MGHIALRTTADPVDASLALRQIVTDLDPRLAVTIETVEEQVTRLSAQQRFAAWLLTAFAALALLLAAAGLYSVASYLVTQRRRDIGVRIAVGAAPGALAQHLVGEATRWCVAGVPLGCVLGWMATRALQSQLYNVQPFDLWSWVGAVATLGLTLLVAVARPAYQAAHVDPVLVLRAD
jgi:ABC-type antimicrobial peptide transport system permease subunit